MAITRIAECHSVGSDEALKILDLHTIRQNCELNQFRSSQNFHCPHTPYSLAFSKIGWRSEKGKHNIFIQEPSIYISAFKPTLPVALPLTAIQKHLLVWNCQLECNVLHPILNQLASMSKKAGHDFIQSNQAHATKSQSFWSWTCGESTIFLPVSSLKTSVSTLSVSSCFAELMRAVESKNT